MLGMVAILRRSAILRMVSLGGMAYHVTPLAPQYPLPSDVVAGWPSTPTSCVKERILSVTCNSELGVATHPSHSHIQPWSSESMQCFNLFQYWWWSSRWQINFKKYGVAVKRYRAKYY